MFALDFLETNTRAYVTYKGRPGVYFFSLEAASLLAVKAARWGWGLPYFHAAMQCTRDGDWFAYETKRRRSQAACTARYRPGALLGPSTEGTFEHFLLERYLLFSVKQDAVYEGEAMHEPYPAQEVELASIDESLIRAAGLERSGSPCAVHYATGVDVEVFGPWKV
jgi:uncharacterized protein YqjF (DUF2071 family)